MTIKDVMNEFMGGLICTAIIFALSLTANHLACTIGGYLEPPIVYVFHLALASAIISTIIYIQDRVKSFFKKNKEI